MSSELYSLYQSQKGKKLTDPFIEDSFQIMLEQEPSLQPYIRNLEIISNDSEVYGAYSLRTQDVSINKQIIPNTDNAHLIALQILRVELEHARNYKTFCEGKKDIETTVIDTTLRDYAQIEGLKRYKELSPFDLISYTLHKKENYESNPEQRLASIRSWKYFVNFFKNQRTSSNPDDLYTARMMLFEAYRRGYKVNRYGLDAPTYEFLINTRLFDDFYWLKNRVEKEDYSYDTRLTYGLPISQYEYYKGIKEKVKLPEIRR